MYWLYQIRYTQTISYITISGVGSWRLIPLQGPIFRIYDQKIVHHKSWYSDWKNTKKRCYTFSTYQASDRVPDRKMTRRDVVVKIPNSGITWTKPPSSNIKHCQGWNKKPEIGVFWQKNTAAATTRYKQTPSTNQTIPICCKTIRTIANLHLSYC